MRRGQNLIETWWWGPVGEGMRKRVHQR